MSTIDLSQGVQQTLLSLQRSWEPPSRPKSRGVIAASAASAGFSTLGSVFMVSDLSARAMDLSRLLDGLAHAIKTLETAHNGLDGLERLVDTAVQTVRQAQGTPSLTPKVVSTLTLAAATPLTGWSSPPSTFEPGDAIRIQVNTVASTLVPIAAGDTIQHLIDKINASSALNPPGAPTIYACLNENGRFQVETLNGQSLSLAVAEGGASLQSIAALLGDAPSTAPAAPLSDVRAAASRQFDELLGQMNTLAKDASYNGVSLLDSASKYTVFTQQDTDIPFVLQGVNLSTTGLGIAASSVAFQSNASLAVALNALDTAVRRLREQDATFSISLSGLQTQQDFTKQAILTLVAGSSDFTLTDTSQEGASLLALDIRQQLSKTSFSLASQADQSVLRVFV